MSSITPVYWELLKCVFEKAGFVLRSESDFNITMKKSGIDELLTILKHSKVYPGSIATNLFIAGMSWSEYMKHLRICKRQLNLEV